MRNARRMTMRNDKKIFFFNGLFLVFNYIISAFCWKSALISESTYKCTPPPALIVILSFCWKSMVLSAALIHNFRYKCCNYVQENTVSLICFDYKILIHIIYNHRNFTVSHRFYTVNYQ